MRHRPRRQHGVRCLGQRWLTGTAPTDVPTARRDRADRGRAGRALTRSTVCSARSSRRRVAGPAVAAAALRPGQRRHGDQRGHRVQAGRLDHGPGPAASPGGAWASVSSSRASPARSRSTPAWRDMAAASAARSAGLAPAPGAGGLEPAGGPGQFLTQQSTARRPAISASVSELDASRLAPCTPGAGRLADRVQAGHAGPAVQVGPDPAAGVVRARRDRDGLGDRVDAPLPARARSRSGTRVSSAPGPGRWRPATGDRPGRRRGPSAAASRPRRRRAGPGRRAGARPPSPAAGRVDQHRARAAQGLGDQRALAARRCPARARSGETARTPRRAARPRPARPAPGRRRSRRPGWSSSRRPGRSRRWPGPRPRARHDARPQRRPSASTSPTSRPPTAPRSSAQRVQRDAARSRISTAAGQQRGQQRAVHLGARRVAAGVHDPVAAVAALQVAAGWPSSRAPSLVSQRDRAGRLRDQRAPRRPGRTARRRRPACPAACRPASSPGPRTAARPPCASGVAPPPSSSLLTSGTRRPGSRRPAPRSCPPRRSPRRRRRPTAPSRPAAGRRRT